MQDTYNGHTNFPWLWQVHQSTRSPALSLPFQWQGMGDNIVAKQGKVSHQRPGDAQPLQRDPRTGAKGPVCKYGDLFCVLIVQNVCSQNNVVLRPVVHQVSQWGSEISYNFLKIDFRNNISKTPFFKQYWLICWETFKITFKETTDCSKSG